MRVFIKCLVVCGIFCIPSLLLAAAKPCGLITNKTFDNLSLLDERIKACEQLANEGNVEAKLELSSLYYKQTFGKYDIKRAEDLARDVAKNGDADGIVLLANLLVHKKNASPKEVIEGIQLFLDVAKQGRAIGGRLTETFETQLDFQDFPEVLTVMESEAEKGDISVLFFLAKHYLKGERLPQNTKAAIHWYTLIMDQGNSIGAYRLGKIFDKGVGIQVDKEKALKYYNIADKQGNRLAKVRRYYLTHKKGALPVLPVPKHQEQTPKWIAELYSDGTIDIIASYKGGEWQRLNFNAWVKQHFVENSLPEVKDPHMTFLALAKLELSGKNEEKKDDWFPQVWYSLKGTEQYHIDRLVQMLGECRRRYSLVVEGNMPFDHALSSDTDEKDPVVIDMVASWNVKEINVEKKVFRGGEESLQALIMSDVKRLEKDSFDQLRKQFRDDSPSFFRERGLGRLNVWQVNERDKHRRVEQDVISKIQLLDGSYIYQIVAVFYYNQESIGVDFNTYYNAWVHDDNGKLNLLNSYMSLGGMMDWKSIEYELPLSVTMVVEDKLYALGSYVPGGYLIYLLNKLGAHQNNNQLGGGRSCD